MKVDNAVIMAAGTSSRFAPLSYETHKALIEVRGEILIERQIRQLKEAGVPEIYIVTGYKAEQFEYLKDKFGIVLIRNPEFQVRNNNSSIFAAKDVICNTFLCSSDNYFARNPFEKEVPEAYYAAVYSDGPTSEWCMEADEEGYIRSVTIGGENAWYMLGHTFWSGEFSREFLKILDRDYDLPATKGKLWESIFLDHLDTLKMKIRKYEPDMIFEFDTLDELRLFDPSYKDDTRSRLLKQCAKELNAGEADLVCVRALKNKEGISEGFMFTCKGIPYRFLYREGKAMCLS